jgi:hypothetical protein
MVDVWPGLEAELEDDLRSDLNPSELDFLARISGARVDNRPFRHEEDTALIGPLVTDPAFRCPAVVGLVVMGPARNGLSYLWPSNQRFGWQRPSFIG